MKFQAFLDKGDFIGLEQYCLTEDARQMVPDVWFYLAIAYYEQQKYEDALTSLQHILKDAATNLNVHSLHAAILCALNRYDDALAVALNVCGFTGNAPSALMNAAAICQQAGRFNESIDFYQQVLAVRPLDLQANIQLATTYALAGRHQEAQKHGRQVLSIFPDCVELYNVLSESFLKSGDWAVALGYCDQGLVLQDTHPLLWFRRGILLSYLRRFEEADTAFAKSSGLQPAIVDVYFDGIQYDRALWAPFNPRLLYLDMAHEMAIRCDWRLWEYYPRVLAEYLAHTPQHQMNARLAFRVFNQSVSPELRCRLMRGISIAALKRAETEIFQDYSFQRDHRPQLRIGYISADFHQHPTSVLTRQLYRLHDRLKFKVYAYSVAPSPSVKDIYRQEIAANCDVFHDVSGMPDTEVADLIHRDSIDILVDLGQYATSDGRLGVLARRPAPIQANYLAFMATTGADYMDYALVDHHVVPDDLRDQWTESLVRMPHSLYLYDNEVSQAPVTLSRQAYGLPEDGVVLCCFNNDYKIDPEIFGVWMAILRSVPNSVLWLLGSLEEGRTNLRNAARSLGVATTRLVFGERVSLDKHLQRYQLADLFLDTYWFNGHTTSLEALWQGLPVLTRRGKVTSSRVAASFLEVLGLQELITERYEDYQAQAIFYATNTQARILLKRKLQEAKRKSPLFNTRQTVRQLELAYELMWAAYLDKQPPKDIDVPEIKQVNW